MNDSANISHEWGQSPESIYNQVVTTFESKQLELLIIDSNIRLGAKPLVTLFESNDFETKILKRGANGIRVIQVRKNPGQELALLPTENKIEFKFGDTTFSADTGEAIFSKNGLDDGTRFLMEVALQRIEQKDELKILDIGCGWGAIGMILDKNVSASGLVMMEKDLASINAAKENVGTAEGRKYIHKDVLAADYDLPEKLMRNFNYIICNPPFHISHHQRDNLFKLAKQSLKKKGQMIFVVEDHFKDRFEKSAKQHLSLITSESSDPFTVFAFRNRT